MDNYYRDNIIRLQELQKTLVHVINDIWLSDAAIAVIGHDRVLNLLNRMAELTELKYDKEEV